MSDSRWFLLRWDEGSPADTVAGLQRAVETARLLHDVPFVVARARADAGPALAKVPGVSGVHLATEDETKIVDGFNSLLREARRYAGDVRANGNPWLPGGSRPQYPEVRAGPDGLRLEPVFGVELPTPTGRFAAISMSLGTSEFDRYDSEHPVNVATRVAAAKFPVVMAAGNVPPAPDLRETLSAYAQAPWVISVAATDSIDGGPIRDHSASGDPADPSTWPTFAAFGASRLDESVRGTSFAAPRVSHELCVFCSFVLTLQALATTGRGVPRVFAGIIDRRIGLMDLQVALSALPLSGIDREALRGVLDALGSAGIAVDLEPTPSVLRRLLLASARPLPSVPAHRAAHGFIGEAGTRALLTGFTGSDFARAFTDAPLDAATERNLAGMRLADNETIDFMVDLWNRAVLVSVVDLADELVVIRPVPGAIP
jgi:hypothetical protein